MLTTDQKDHLATINALLYMHERNRRMVPVQSGATELSPVEFVFYTAYQFRHQVFCNGFAGFVSNTYGTLTDFLPIALAAIGAPRFSLLARLAWEDRNEENGTFDSQFFDLFPEEDLDGLLLAYAQQHRDDLPDPASWTLELARQWENDRDRWLAEKHRSQDFPPSA
jgi:hypothetical protein